MDITVEHKVKLEQSISKHKLIHIPPPVSTLVTKRVIKLTHNGREQTFDIPINQKAVAIIADKYNLIDYVHGQVERNIEVILNGPDRRNTEE